MKSKMPDHDPVNHPSHYTSYKGLEIIDLTEQMNFNRGNAVKYIARAGLKNPATEVEDLRKAAWYLQREIERIDGKTEEPEEGESAVEPVKVNTRATRLRYYCITCLAEHGPETDICPNTHGGPHLIGVAEIFYPSAERAKELNDDRN